MKQKLSFLLALCLFCACLSPASTAQASGSKVVKLKENKTYYYNLNGDKKKEKIEIKCKYRKNSNDTIQVYVNEEKLFSQKDDYLYGMFYLIDLNAKDKYKELLVETHSDSEVNAAFEAIRYQGKNKKSILKSNGIHGDKIKCNSRQLELYRFSLLSNTGKNKFYISADRPYSNTYFGSYYCKVPVTVKNGKLVAQKSSTYETAAFTKKFVYQLNRSMALYSKASTSSKSITCKSGSKFKALSLKPVETTKANGALFVKVKMTSGKIGWLYFPALSKNNTNFNYYLKTVPGWG